MQPNDKNIPITHEIEQFYKAVLAEEKIMWARTLKVSTIYAISIIIIIISLPPLIVALILAIYYFPSIKTSTDYLGVPYFIFSLLSGLILFLLGIFSKTFIIVKTLRNINEHYYKNSKNLLSFKNSGKLLTAYRYQKLKEKYKNNKLEKLAQFYKTKSLELQKKKLYPVTIFSVLLLSLWSAYLGAIFGDSSLNINGKTEAALFFFLVSLGIVFIIFSFRKWYDLIILEEYRMILDLSKILELIILERENEN